MKFTPGNWDWDYDKDNKCYRINAVHRVVTEVLETRDKQRDFADAKLIAKAPEMYKLLKRITYSPHWTFVEIEKLLNEIEGGDTNVRE